MPDEPQLGGGFLVGPQAGGLNHVRLGEKPHRREQQKDKYEKIHSPLRL